MFSNFALVFRSMKDHTIHCEAEGLFCGDSPIDVVVLAYLHGFASNGKRHAQICLFGGRHCYALPE